MPMLSFADVSMVLSLATLVLDEPGSPTVAVARIGGDVDVSDHPALARLFARLVGGDAHLDLGDLGFAGAFFVDRLVRLARVADARGDRLTVGPVPASLARLLVLLGLEDRFDVVPDPGEARCDLRGS